CDLGLRRERRMATREDQPEPVFRHGRLLSRNREMLRDFLVLPRQPPVAPQSIDRLVPPGGDQPRHRIAGRAGRRPLLDRRGERILKGFSGKSEAPEQADQRRKTPPVPRTKAVCEAQGRRGESLPGGTPPRRRWRYRGGGPPSMTGRTSIEPPICTDGTRAA